MLKCVHAGPVGICFCIVQHWFHQGVWVASSLATISLLHFSVNKSTLGLALCEYCTTKVLETGNTQTRRHQNKVKCQGNLRYITFHCTQNTSNRSFCFLQTLHCKTVFLWVLKQIFGQLLRRSRGVHPVCYLACSIPSGFVCLYWRKTATNASYFSVIFPACLLYIDIYIRQKIGLCSELKSIYMCRIFLFAKSKFCQNNSFHGKEYYFAFSCTVISPASLTCWRVKPSWSVWHYNCVIQSQN